MPKAKYLSEEAIQAFFSTESIYALSNRLQLSASLIIKRWEERFGPEACNERKQRLASLRRSPEQKAEKKQQTIEKNKVKRAHQQRLRYLKHKNDLYRHTTCPITLKPYESGNKRLALTSPSLDRINPALGYTRENCRVISHHANTMKQGCTDPATFRRLAAYIASKGKSVV